MITQTLTELFSAAFEKCGYAGELGIVTTSNRMDLCQFQCNGAMRAAKLYKKAPIVIANEVIEMIDKANFSTLEAVSPGFINISLNQEWLLSLVNEVAGDEHSGIPQIGKGQTLVLDYGGANVAKPLHIGHLRPAIIGESVKRIAKACGMNVIGDVHLGDWGLQIGLVIAELKERNPEWDCFKEDFDAEKESVQTLTTELLTEIYPFASKKSKEDEEFKKKAGDVTVDFQNEHPGYMALWKEIMRVSLVDLKRNYDIMGAEFDLWYGESDSAKYIPELMDILMKKKLLVESEGAMVVEVAEETDKVTMPPVIVKKSDNSGTYATTDLATIVQRQKDFAPDKIWYVVDKRQDLHFKQVFRCAKKAEIVPRETDFYFLGFGTMNGKDGKPYKTRDGGVMQLSVFLDTVTEAAFEKLNTSEFVSEEHKKDIGAKLGMAAVKFGDLINYCLRDYVFDLDKFLSFEGKTGVYVLYTVTRINSILKKSGYIEGAKMPISGIYTDIEKDIILNIILTGEVFKRAIEEKAPSYICENVYQLATLFSRFYHDSHIVNEQDEEKRNSWMALSAMTKKMLEMQLDVLGIETVENM